MSIVLNKEKFIIPSDPHISRQLFVDGDPFKMVFRELSASVLGLTPAAVVSFFQGEEVPGNYERQQRKYQSNR
jgi:hypothetical protein